MHDSPVKTRDLILTFLFSLIILVCLFLLNYFDKTTKIVFCDVGQGDAAYIRIKNQIDVLIDAGPDNKALSCLGKYMPFYDRKIELVIISHPQKDHFGGLVSILNHYQVDKIIAPAVDSSSRSYRLLKNLISAKKIVVSSATAGDKIVINNTRLVFFWPSERFLKSNLVFDQPRKIGNIILGASGLDANFFSQILAYQEGAVSVLFTGDAPGSVLDGLEEKDKSKTTILKIPHHGSKNGLTKNFLRLADPGLAVISVGKNNSIGHPGKEVLEILQAQNVKIKRTDIDGDIIFKIQSSKFK